MERLTVDQLVHQFQVSHRSHFTGRMDLRSTKGEHWSLYFHLGRLVWTTGGQHRFSALVSHPAAVLSRH